MDHLFQTGEEDFAAPDAALRRASPPAAPLLSERSRETPLPPLLEALVERLEPEDLRDFMAGAFGEFARLTDRLRLIHAALEGGEKADDVRFLFDRLRHSTGSLLSHLHAAALRVDSLDTALADALDGTCFALRHELRAVFESNLLAPAAKPKANMVRAHGLLLNCFQQSVIALARVFDETLTGVALFDDLKLRQERSLALYQELREILELVLEAEREADLFSVFVLERRLREFRAGRMRYLMFRDWAEFEGFIDALPAPSRRDVVREVLHSFARYLETLISHVGMRAVLTEEQHEVA